MKDPYHILPPITTSTAKLEVTSWSTTSAHTHTLTANDDPYFIGFVFITLCFVVLYLQVNEYRKY
jgi:hypothetical protein